MYCSTWSRLDRFKGIENLNFGATRGGKRDQNTNSFCQWVRYKIRKEGIIPCSINPIAK